MPLHVKTLAEPFSEHAKAQEPILAESKEYERLRKDLERYTNGEILGRSYLIGGHRGSGKTMLVHQAIENLIRLSQDKPNRPLFVRLHGPDLLPPLTEDEKEPEKAKAPAADAAEPTKETKAPETAQDLKAAAAKKAVEEQLKKRTADEKELEAVLIQMVKALYRDVSNEYRRCYREAVLRLNDGIVRDDLLEVAAQFDLELTDYVRPERLRSFWQRINAFRRGILFAVDRSAYSVYLPPPDKSTTAKTGTDESATAQSANPQAANAQSIIVEPATAVLKKPPLVATDIGFQEILVLSFLSEAFRITSGKLEDISRQLSSDTDKRTTSLSTAYELKNLLAPVAGLLSGGFVGLSAIGSINPFAAVFLGLVTGAVVSFAFSYKSERSRNRENSLESVFTKDRSITTLSSVVPLLVVRLKQVGLAPIFVIDELDKVENLVSRMTNLVRHLKFLVTENSFSCFLVDRRYFSYLTRQSTKTAYAREYTYFSDRLLVLYSPAALRGFVAKALESVSGESPHHPVTPTATDKMQVEKIGYSLLFRARMHPIDLRRQLDSLTSMPSFTMAQSFPSPRYRFEILMQVAIEWLLDGDDVKTRLSGTPHYRQVLYDALYYVPRLWEDAGSDDPQVPGFHDFRTNDNERKPGLVLDNEKFAEYLESRIAAEEGVKTNKPVQTKKKTQPKKEPRLSGKDFAFLMEKVRDLLRFLCHPDELVEDIRRTPRTDKPTDIILSEIPKEVDLRLIIQKDGEPKYRWLYDVSGSTLQTREVNLIKAEVKDAIIYIRACMGDLDALGLSGDLQTLAEDELIPRPSELEQRVTPALHRLEELRGGGDEYADMIADRDVVREFATTLEAFEPIINAALLGAAVFAPEVALSKPTPGAQLAVALKQVSDTLGLTAIPEDLGKLESLLRSVPGRTFDIHVDLTEVIKVVNQLLAAKPATDETANPIIANAWSRYRERFSRHFQEGIAKFDPDYFDLFSLFRKKGPGVEMGSDFSTITARVWSRLLLRSLSGSDLPRWLAVAAALELRLFELAQKLAAQLEASDPLMGRWVEDAQRRLTKDTPRTNALIITLSETSTPDSWLPSTKNGAAVLRLQEVNNLMEDLKNSQVVTSPSDYPFHLIATQIPTDQMQRRVSVMPPARALATISSTSLTKDLEELLKKVKVSYFVSELSATFPQGSVPMVTAPTTIDGLIEGSLRSPSPAPTA